MPDEKPECLKPRGMTMCGDEKRPSPRAFLTNLRVDLPWPTKLRLLLRNNLIKLTRGQVCCGHPGEPGC